MQMPARANWSHMKPNPSCNSKEALDPEPWEPNASYNHSKPARASTTLNSNISVVVVGVVFRGSPTPFSNNSYFQHDFPWLRSCFPCFNNLSMYVHVGARPSVLNHPLYGSIMLQKRSTLRKTSTSSTGHSQVQGGRDLVNLDPLSLQPTY